MDKLEAYKTFSAVVELGGFTKAAKVLHMSQPTISRVIGTLEKELECSLFQRNTRWVIITEEGQRFYNFVQQILSKIEAEEALLSHSKKEPSGVIHMTAPHQFFQSFILPTLPNFYKQYPKISLTIQLANSVENLEENQYDLAIRISNENAAPYQAEKIGETHRIVVASPTYLNQYGCPKNPSDLKNHNCLLFQPKHKDNKWEFRDRKNKSILMPVNGNISINGMLSIAKLAVVGEGIAYLSNYYIISELREKKLVLILSSHTNNSTNINIIHPYKHFIPARVKCFISFLKNQNILP